MYKLYTAPAEAMGSVPMTVETSTNMCIQPDTISNPKPNANPILLNSTQ